MVLYSLFVSVDRKLDIYRADAHCDISSKIHDPIAAHLSTFTALRCLTPKRHQNWHCENESLDKKQMES